MRISDWSSDVCSSDLRLLLAVDGHRRTLGPGRNAQLHREAAIAGLAHRDAHGVGLRVAGFLRDFDGTAAAVPGDRKSVVQARSVSVSVALGGRRIIKKKKQDTSRACPSVKG